MLTALYRSAIVWTVVGLVGGVSYREMTKFAGFTGTTHLSVVHTHALALGTLMLLIVLALTVALKLQRHRLLRLFVIVWNVGLTITIGMLAFKGFVQVQGASWADSAALAGIAGLGHITLTVGFVLLLMVVGAGVKAANGVDVPALQLQAGER